MLAGVVRLPPLPHPTVGAKSRGVTTVETGAEAGSGLFGHSKATHLDLNINHPEDVIGPRRGGFPKGRNRSIGEEC